MATDILSSAIDNAITMSNSWLTRNTLPFMATILRNADDSIPTDIKFDDSYITEVAWRTYQKYMAYQYTYKDWYDGMYEYLGDHILMETRTPLAVSLQTEPDMAQVKGTSKIIFIIAAIAILLLLLPERENTQRLSDLRKRRNRRLFFISNGKVIPRSEVDTAKRMARAGYGKVHAVWAYNADEAREYIRQGKAETLGSLQGIDNISVSINKVPSYGTYKRLMTEIKPELQSNKQLINNLARIRAIEFAFFQNILPSDYYNPTAYGPIPVDPYIAVNPKFWIEEYLTEIKKRKLDKADSYTIWLDLHHLLPKRAEHEIEPTWKRKEKIIPEERGQMTLFGLRKPVELHGLNLPKQPDSLPPILGWVGGKTKLADKIISMMPQHKVYVEPFLGGGSVFFKKPLADVNVINDLDIDLMNFYKGVRDGSCEKIRECKLPKNRKEFDKAVDNRGKDICSYLGVNKTSYGSIMVNPKPSTGKSSKNAIKVKDSCDRYKEKLKQTKMLNKDFKDVIKEFDSKDTLAYIDPPYVDVTLYKHNDINPEDVAKLVKTMKGKAIVSYNNRPRVRKAFAGLNFHKVKTRYELQKSMTGIPKDVSELIITNF